MRRIEIALLFLGVSAPLSPLPAMTAMSAVPALSNCYARILGDLCLFWLKNRARFVGR
jgi:hypothetical protein